METCPSCGEPAHFEITEVFPELREVHVQACCEANRAGWIDAIGLTSRKERRAWMLRETGILVSASIPKNTLLKQRLNQ
jgi:hypothetical protein